ncbi:MAG: hypothetical protein ABW022_01990 [Actinoplanes sp.]
MRTAKLLLGLLLLTTAAACAGSTDNGTGVATAQSDAATPGASPSATASRDPDAPLKFAKCMREQGLAWFPDPDANGRTVVKMPKGVDRATFGAAEEACKQYAPSRDGDGPADPEMLEQARQMAKCMRENGVPNFPDPQPNGGIELNRDQIGEGPGSPTFDRAEEKCAKFMPRPDGPDGPDA